LDEVSRTVLSAAAACLFVALGLDSRVYHEIPVEALETPWQVVQLVLGWLPAAALVE